MLVPVVSPLRVTVKVKGVLPLLPSALFAESAAMAISESSLRIVPVAVAVVMVYPAEGVESVTVKPSSGSIVESPRTLTVIVVLVSPAAKLTVPVGSAPPAKSAAVTPLPLTAQLAVLVPVVSPLRVTVKVKGVAPALPSALFAEAAVIEIVEDNTILNVRSKFM